MQRTRRREFAVAMRRKCKNAAGVCSSNATRRARARSPRRAGETGSSVQGAPCTVSATRGAGAAERRNAACKGNATQRARAAPPRARAPKKCIVRARGRCGASCKGSRVRNARCTGKAPRVRARSAMRRAEVARCKRATCTGRATPVACVRWMQRGLHGPCDARCARTVNATPRAHPSDAPCVRAGNAARRTRAVQCTRRVQRSVHNHPGATHGVHHVLHLARLQTPTPLLVIPSTALRAPLHTCVRAHPCTAARTHACTSLHTHVRA